MTSSKVFVDTNVLVYSVDVRDLDKRDLARASLAGLREGGACISTQIMQEFYVVATRKGKLSAQDAKTYLQIFREQFQLITVSPDMIEQAIDCSIMNQLSYWDAMLFVCAASAGCREIWTEDLNAGQMISGVRVVNPFENTSR